MSCKSNGQFRFFYTGNQVGSLNETGCFNFVAGGPPGSGLSSGTLVKKFFQTGFNRALWQGQDAELSQKLLDAAMPFIELQWIIEIKVSSDKTFYMSDRNIYVKDEEGKPRFYEARVERAPSPSITTGEWLSDTFSIDNLSVTLNNRDGLFNDYLPQGELYTQWIGGTVKILVGFGEERSNYFELFEGIIPEKKPVETTLESVIVNCYGKAQEDKVEIPTLLFDRTNFPFADSSSIGKPLPIIYGDWTEEVSEFGDIPAICSNARDADANFHIWNVSENALQEIGDVYLHRGNRTDENEGPILLLDNAITKDASAGRIIIPKDIPVLSESYVIKDNGKPGAVGAIGEILAESSSQDFVKLGINDGDTIFKEGDTVPYTISAVLPGSLQTTIPTVMTPDNSYKILTDKYTFKSGDKISLLCKGKDIEVMSVTRLADSGLLGSNPLITSIGLKNDFWTVDNDAQKIYNVSFNNEIIKEIPYVDVSSDITEISGMDIQTDGTLWVFDKPMSTIYRYVVEEDSLGLSFSTFQVSGLETIFTNAGPLSIDDGNVITLHDQTSGDFYRISPFAGAQPGLIGTYNRNDFEANALDIVDIAADVNLNQIICLDRNTSKVYRIDQDNGSLITSFELSKVSNNFTQARGVGYYIDGTIFLLNKQDLSIYNYNEFPGANENPGFIARDILQSYAGKTTFDFDLRWNEACRGSLSELKSRISIDTNTNTLDLLTKFLKGFNVSMYFYFQKYSLFHIEFENFSTNGLSIKEGDIEFKSFKPQKEFGQYFNAAFASYKKRPFSGSTISSDNYVSPSGVQLAGGKEIKKDLDLASVYRREDLDKLMPLFVRLAAAEPEFISVTLSFRFLFAQLNTFYNINFKDLFNKNEKSGRRFDNVPSFVRKIQFDLNTMKLKVKLWSLGTTQFGDYLPVGVVGGGQNDQIILTNLGTAGYVAPIGSIVSNSLTTLTIENVDGLTAEDRETPVVGKAWDTNYKIGIYSGEDHTLVEELTIYSVSGQIITLTSNIVNVISPTVKNSAGFIIGGHYIKYLGFNNSTQQQQDFFCYYCRPLEGYAQTTSEEIENQRAGLHNFDNGRLPYVLHPVDYVPN